MADTRTLGNMIDRIASELARDDLGSSTDPLTVYTSSIYNAIQDAVTEYQREHFFQGEGIDSTTTTTQGTNLYPVPSDFISMTQLDIIVNGTVITLIDKSYQELDTMDSIASIPTQGVPGWYALYNNQIRLYPTPNDSTYTLRFIYQAKVLEPTQIGDTNFWTTTAESLIRSRAKWSLNLEVLRNAEDAILDKKREEECLRKIMQETAQKLFTGSLVATRF